MMNERLYVYADKGLQIYASIRYYSQDILHARTHLADQYCAPTQRQLTYRMSIHVLLYIYTSSFSKSAVAKTSSYVSTLQLGKITDCHGGIPE